MRERLRHAFHRISNRSLQKMYPLRSNPPGDFSEAVQWRISRVLRLLSSPPVSWEVRRVSRLDSGEGSHPTWNIRLISLGPVGNAPAPGDMFFVKWRNSPEKVQKILDIFGEDGSRRVSRGDSSSVFHPGKMVSGNLRDILEREIDIDEAGGELLAWAGLNERALQLKRFHKAHRAYHRRILRSRNWDLPHPELQGMGYSLIHILEEMKELPDIRDLVRWQPGVEGRPYTVSGSSLTRDGRLEVEITVSRVFKQLKNVQHRRITLPARSSAFLTNRKPGDTVNAWLLPELHQFPHRLERKSPGLIAVATGSGISGPLSLLRSGEYGSPLWLIYGVRSWEANSLYGSELLEYERRGLISRLDIAESRPSDSARKSEYVQAIIWEQREEIVRQLGNGAHIYLCGRLSMGRQVRELFQEIFLDQGLVSSPGEAERFMEELEHRLIFQASVSGV